MKLNIEVNNKSKSPVRKSFIRNAAELALAECGFEFLREKAIGLSFALVSPEEIKELNRIYRKKNKATDVLSFPEYASQNALQNDQDMEIFLGEIILCYNDIKDYLSPDKAEKTLERELANVISHGVLHLLGFRHGQKMFDIQKRVIRKMFTN